MVGKVDNWRCAAHDRDSPHALRHGGGCCVGVGSATGNPEHAKFTDAEMIRPVVAQRAANRSIHDWAANSIR